MTPRQALTYPHPIFTKVATPVEEIDDEALEVAKGLIDLLRANPQVPGVAAPALGSTLRIIAVDVSGRPEATADHGPMVIMNPQVTASDDLVSATETCLALPGRAFEVTRPERIFLRGMNIDGTEISAETSGLEARAILHQIDHLDGRLPWGTTRIEDLPRSSDR